jgi:hypothetical protein
MAFEFQMEKAKTCGHHGTRPGAFGSWLSQCALGDLGPGYDQYPGSHQLIAHIVDGHAYHEPAVIAAA